MLSPTIPLVAAVPTAVLLGIATATATGPLLRMLPAETESEAGDTQGTGPAGPTLLGSAPPDRPPDYGALAGRGFATACGAVSLVASLLVLTLAPLPWLPLWLVWSTLFVVLVGVDAATTWLPLGLTRATWAAGAVALALSGGLVLALGRGTAADPVRVLLGAAAAGALYLALWRVGRGLGFGDVRISPLLGALGAALSWTEWWVALAAGPLLGAVWGIVRSVAGHRGPYAYGPWMWLGPAAALLAQPTGPLVA
ncbi:leader peptidase (prepilin peptidase) / N-methyltransferase [Raineyella antarctica]|uniref:Leader peptidase (Prepilin peptidase) / N-methyltransferase n=1 Tax=Raineyella antarctica TaxID=1577474 RepID=A0A1G6GG22_9ACTN|nr:hypothetical protein [Raineyella antarctica]SDB80126.1 leader peptidase (prepilin peptidase) / N-methyltransferase [Raineyella antarctica]